MTAYKAVALRSVVMANFVTQLALMPVSVVLPTIARDLGADLTVASWIMTSYLFTMTGLVLISGRLGDRFGHGRVFLIGMGLFGVVSGLGALAWTAEQLIVARALQGIGGALVLGNGLAIISGEFDEGQRGKAIGAAAAGSGFGAVCGLVFGTFAVEFADWRWLFAVGLPLSLLGVVLGWRLASKPHQPTAHRIDLAGALVLALALSVGALGLNHLHSGPETWADGWTYHLPMHVATIGGLYLLVLIERRVRDPIIDLASFRNALFTGSIVANGILHMTMMAVVFLIPFLVQRGWGMTPIETGLLLLASQVVNMAMSFGGGWIYDRTRSKLLAPASLLVVGLGFIMLGLTAERLTFVQLLLSLPVISCASGMFMTANNTVIMSSLPSDRHGFASGMTETTRQLGHGVAITIVSATMALSGDVSVNSQLLIEGFGRSTVVMGLIAFVGVVLSYPPTARRLHDLVSRPAPALLGLFK